MRWALWSVGCLALLQLLLAIHVSMQRGRSKIICGMPDDPEHPLHRAVAAHRNACEYIPLLCLLILIPQVHGAPEWSLWLGPALVLARCSQALGLLNFTLTRPNPFRMLGSALTFGLGLTLVGLIFWQEAPGGSPLP